MHSRTPAGGTASCCAWCSRWRSEEHTSELQSLTNLVCRLLLEIKKYVDQDQTRVQLVQFVSTYTGMSHLFHDHPPTGRALATIDGEEFWRRISTQPPPQGSNPR